VLCPPKFRATHLWNKSKSQSDGHTWRGLCVLEVSGPPRSPSIICYCCFLLLHKLVDFLMSRYPLERGPSRTVWGIANSPSTRECLSRSSVCPRIRCIPISHQPVAAPWRIEWQKPFILPSVQSLAETHCLHNISSSLSKFTDCFASKLQIIQNTKCKTVSAFPPCTFHFPNMPPKHGASGQCQFHLVVTKPQTRPTMPPEETAHLRRRGIPAKNGYHNMLSIGPKSWALEN